MGDNIVVLSTKAMLGGRLLRDLRELSEVVIPEGTEKIESFWFRQSSVKSIVIPKSVEVIEQGAFRKCENLKRVSFQARSRLEKIGVECFEYSGLEEITLPASVREVGAEAFECC